MSRYFFDRPVPPPCFLEKGDRLIAEPLSDGSRRVSSHDRVGFDIFYNNGSCGDDGAVADIDSRHYRRIEADPYVVPDDGVPFPGQLIGFRHDSLPAFSKNLEGVGREATDFMVGAVHDEGDAAGDSAELADDQFVIQERVMV